MDAKPPARTWGAGPPVPKAAVSEHWPVLQGPGSQSVAGLRKEVRFWGLNPQAQGKEGGWWGGESQGGPALFQGFVQWQSRGLGGLGSRWGSVLCPVSQIRGA